MQKFSPDYVSTCFLIWYQKGKIGMKDLWNSIPPDVLGDKPSVQILGRWIRDDFVERAKEMDEQINRQIAEKAVAIKIEMLERHASLGEKMQEMALKYLDDHEDNLGVGSSVRLLIEGVRIERESRGLPEALEGLSSKSDEELLKEIEKIVTSAPVTLLPADGGRNEQQ